MEGDRERNKYRRLDNMFWRDLRIYLSKNNKNVGPAPEMPTTLLSPKEQRQLRVSCRAVQLKDQGVEPIEARRQAFNEIYPKDSSSP